MNTFGVILPAAGTGTRFGGGDKLLVDLCGQSVLQRSVALFASRPDVARILVVTGADRLAAYRDHLLPAPTTAGAPGSPCARAASLWRSKLAFAEGGSARWESVLKGLRVIAQGDPPEFVAIHDAARPLCPADVIDQAFQVTRQRRAALPCLAEPATLKRRASDGTVSETVDRSALFQAQTPQCFHLQSLLEGYERLVRENRVHDLTDDAQVFERIHLAVPITPGSPVNLKITTAADVDLARALLTTNQGSPA